MALVSVPSLARALDKLDGALPGGAWVAGPASAPPHTHTHPAGLGAAPLPTPKARRPTPPKENPAKQKSQPPPSPKLILQQRNKGALPCLFPFVLQLAGL